ncbi:MAG: hypothetical protein RBT06_01540 [Smithellaceae bacterium]|nr:hypothetical protein [Smithellaceae bacterium]
MSGLPERLAAWPAGKSLPMTINDRGRNPAQADRTLHAPAEARRAVRDLAKNGGGEAAGVLARSTGRGPCANLRNRQPVSFSGLLFWASDDKKLVLSN